MILMKSQKSIKAKTNEKIQFLAQPGPPLGVNWRTLNGPRPSPRLAANLACLELFELAHTTRPVILLSLLLCVLVVTRKLFFTPVTHSHSVHRTYLLCLDPVTHFIPSFHSLSIQAHTPSALATLSTSESSSLSPTHLCSKSHLLSILRFQDDCIASYPHSTAPIRRRTSLIVVDISRYPRIIDPRHQATLVSLTLYLNPQTTT